MGVAIFGDLVLFVSVGQGNSRMWRWIGAATVALAIAFLLWWALRVYTPDIASDPKAPGEAIASLEQADLGGDKQWVLIRGRDRHAPIILFLHGGPGMPMMYLAHVFQRQLENDFLTVQWDRRGAGKSYFADTEISKMSMRQEMADTISLMQALRSRFGAQKIILVGHSYGSELGILVASARPDLIRAYVGVGQVACDRATELNLQDKWIAAQARNQGDITTSAHALAGKPYDRESALFRYGGEIVGHTSFLYLVGLGLRAPEYSLLDAYHVKAGVDFTHAHLRNDAFRGPLMDAVPRLSVPVYFFEGLHDETAPASCAVQYFNRLDTPQKRLIWFDNSAHFPFLEEPDQFRRALRLVAAETTASTR